MYAEAETPRVVVAEHPVRPRALRGGGLAQQSRREQPARQQRRVEAGERPRGAVTGTVAPMGAPMGARRSVVLLAVSVVAVLPLAGCAEVNTAVDEASSATDKAKVCAEALGLADLNPLVDPEKLKARAEDKERRLRELADGVADQDVKASLLTMADSYVEVQKERIDDLSVVAAWAERNAAHVDALRDACA
jgi:hypothetical protein